MEDHGKIFVEWLGDIFMETPTEKMIEKLKTWLMLHGRYAHKEDRAPKEAYEAVEECLKKLKKVVE
jgi:TorA maturation chaperone TorD|tara:strand:+ start:1458 stop:1655 length:198 start_codon:yes stop_codon:yes gene_type:complete